jgi:hypothetical protein
MSHGNKQIWLGHSNAIDIMRSDRTVAFTLTESGITEVADPLIKTDAIQLNTPAGTLEFKDSDGNNWAVFDETAYAFSMVNGTSMLATYLAAPGMNTLLIKAGETMTSPVSINLGDGLADFNIPWIKFTAPTRLQIFGDLFFSNNADVHILDLDVSSLAATFGGTIKTDTLQALTDAGIQLKSDGGDPAFEVKDIFPGYPGIVGGAGMPALSIYSGETSQPIYIYNVNDATGLTINETTASLGASGGGSVSCSDHVNLYSADDKSATVRVGASDSQAAIGGVIAKYLTPVGNIGATAGQPLHSHDFTSAISNILNMEGRGYRVKTWGTVFGTANVKTIELYAGNFFPISATAAPSVSDAWEIVLEVYRMPTTGGHDITYNATFMGNIGTANALVYTQTAGADGLSASSWSVVELQASGTGTDDVVCLGMVVEIIN